MEPTLEIRIDQTIGLPGILNRNDANGERVYEERITGFKGRYERTLDLTDKATGSYYLVIQQGGKTTAQKLVKQ